MQTKVDNENFAVFRSSLQLKSSCRSPKSLSMYSHMFECMQQWLGQSFIFSYFTGNNSVLAYLQLLLPQFTHKIHNCKTVTQEDQNYTCV